MARDSAKPKNWSSFDFEVKAESLDSRRSFNDGTKAGKPLFSKTSHA